MNLDELSIRPGGPFSKQKKSNSKRKPSTDVQAPIDINPRNSSMTRKKPELNLGEMDFKQDNSAKLQNRQHEKILLEADAEYKRRGNFHLIFPFTSANCH